MPENSEHPRPKPKISINVAGDLSGNMNVAGGDIITVGDVNASVAAIGAGAQVIYNNVERALSQVEMADKALQLEQERLAEAVKAYVARLQHQAEQGKQIIIEGNTPYKALLSYDIEDAALFYGRSKAIAELLGKIGRDELTVLHADSGAGKSSLVKAGIMSRLLAAGAVPLYVRPYLTTVPYAIKRALVPQLEQTPNLAVASLHDFLGYVTDRLGGTQVIIILDQFEEFFILQTPDQRKEFIAELGPCLDDDLLPVRWLLSLRKEWFGDLGTFRPQVKDPFANEYMLKALSAEEAHEVIVEPALRFGVTYEKGLVNALIEDLGEKEIAPPQLQIVCSALFDALDGSKEITTSLYNSLGGTSGILRTHLDRVIKRNVPVGQRQAARLLLEALVTSDRRRAVRTREELTAELRVLKVEKATLDELLQILVDSRLLISEEIEKDDKDFVAYELAHDYLITNIELDPAAEARKSAQELLDREIESFRRLKTVLGPDKLAIIEAHKEELNIPEDGKKLLAESEKKLAQQRVTYLAGAGVVVALVILAVISVSTTVGAQRLRSSALNQLATAQAAANIAGTQQASSEQSRLIGTSRLLALNAQTALNNGDVLRAARLAVQAYQAYPTAESIAALFAASQEHFPTITLPTTDEEMSFVRFSQDSSRVMVASNAPSFYVADAATGSVIAQFDLAAGPTLLDTDATLSRIAVLTFASTSQGNQVDIYSLDGKTPVYTFGPSSEFIQYIALSPDGNNLALSTSTGRVLLITLATGTQTELRSAPPADSATGGETFVDARLKFDSQGSHLVTVINNTLTSYDLATGEAVGELAMDSQIAAIAAVPGKSAVALALPDVSAVAFIDLATATETRRTVVNPGNLFDLVVAPDGESFVLFNINTGVSERYSPGADAPGQQFTSGDTFLAGGLIPAGNRLLTLSRLDVNKVLLLADSSDVELQNPSAVISESGPVSAAFSPDGRYLLTSGKTRTPHLWKVDDLIRSQAVPLINDKVWLVFPSEMTSDLVMLDYSSTLSWFDLSSEPPALKAKLAGDTGTAFPIGAGFTSQGPLAVIVNQLEQVPALRVHALSSGELLVKIQPRDVVTMVALSPDGKQVAGYDVNQGLTVWSTETGDVLATLPPNRDVTNITFSPDSSRLAVATANGRWTIYSVPAAEVVATGRHRRSVNSIRFNQDGSQIVTGSDDGTVKLWDVASATEIVSFDTGKKVTSAIYSPDGSRFIVRDDGGQFKILNASDGQVLADLGAVSYFSVQLAPDNSKIWASIYPSDLYTLILAPDQLVETLKARLAALGLPVGP